MKAYTIALLLFVGTLCAGWATNVVNVITGFGSDIGILYVAQCFGIAAFPLGSVLGIASWF